MSPGWRDLVVLTFLVLLLGAAMIANVSDGPMREHPARGNPRHAIANGTRLRSRLEMPPWLATWFG